MTETWPPPTWAPPGRAAPSRPPTPADPSPGRLLVLSMGGGLALEAGLRGGAANAVVAAGVACLVAVLLLDRRLRRTASRRLALASLVPAAFLFVRASPWLAASNGGTIVGLLAMAVLFDRKGSRTDTGPGDLARRLGLALPTVLRAPSLLAPLRPTPSAESARRLARVGRAALVAAPVLGVIVVLLASADPVFASFLHPDLHLGPVAGHVAGAIVALAVLLAIVAAATADTDGPRRTGTFGAVEIATMLALTAGVLALFVVAQLVALTGAGKRLVEASGFTPADYARRGFFQLCWATALLLGLLALIERLSTAGVRENRAIRVLGAAVPLLALGLVAVSLRRMALYDQAFGLTMLRLWVVGAAAWFGIVLVLVALRNLGVGGDRRWVFAGAGLAMVALVVLADVADPEAFVVRHDVARARSGVVLDAGYLRHLSDDAVPAILAAEHGSPGPQAAQALRDAAACTDRRRGAAALNLAAVRAESSAGQRPCRAEAP